MALSLTSPTRDHLFGGRNPNVRTLEGCCFGGGGELRLDADDAVLPADRGRSNGAPEQR